MTTRAREQVGLPAGGRVALGELRHDSGRGSEQSEVHDQECDSNSAGQEAQGSGDTSKDPALPLGKAEPGGHRIARKLLPTCGPMQCISLAPYPEHPGPADLDLW